MTSLLFLQRIEEAYVPLIRMKFCNVEIDMVFARLELDEISEYPVRHLFT